MQRHGGKRLSLKGRRESRRGKIAKLRLDGTLSTRTKQPARFVRKEARPCVRQNPVRWSEEASVGLREERDAMRGDERRCGWSAGRRCGWQRRRTEASREERTEASREERRQSNR
eukprot:5469079-Pleurochrysis_carterae.AAC.1